MKVLRYIRAALKY